MVRERRDHVHRAVHDERRRFLPAQDAGREGEGHLKVADRLRGDLVQRAETSGGIVLRRHRPAAVIPRRRCLRRDGLLSYGAITGQDQRHERRAENAESAART